MPEFLFKQHTKIDRELINSVTYLHFIIGQANLHPTEIHLQHYSIDDHYDLLLNSNTNE